MSRVLLLLVSALCLAAAPATEVPAREAWRPAQDWLRERCKEVAANLDLARELLLQRAEGNAELTELLTPGPVRIRRPGYGVLPRVREDAPLSAVELRQQRFSLERLTTVFAPEFRDAALLAGSAGDPRTSLEEQVVEFERIRQRLLKLEDHLGYHGYWQRAVVDYPKFFDERNRVITQLKSLESRRRRGGDDEEIAAARTALVDRLAPFEATPGLALEDREDGWNVLRVSVTTDIDDERFLAIFREGVEAAFVEDDAVRALRFRIDLRFRRVGGEQLYPEGPPKHGERIDPEQHLSRFPDGELVLTTGEESTHAWTGKSIVLGPEEVSRRTLAHEFGHLIGFRDAYLRGFEGEPDSRFGVELIEWTGLRDDLMGNARGGRVTPEMVEILIEAYGGR
jgi:hypothetical protein